MRKEKQLLLDDIKAKIENAKAFIVTQYQSITANELNQFRRSVADQGNDFEIMAKRILIKVAATQGVEIKKEHLQGHIGIVIAKNDYIQATKELRKFSTDSGKMEILAGCIEGQLYDKESVIKLSELPSMDEMRAQFIGTLEAPMSQTLATFEALLTSVMHCIDNKAKKESN